MASHFLTCQSCVEKSCESSSKIRWLWRSLFFSSAHFMAGWGKSPSAPLIFNLTGAYLASWPNKLPLNEGRKEPLRAVEIDTQIVFCQERVAASLRTSPYNKKKRWLRASYHTWLWNRYSFSDERSQQISFCLWNFCTKPSHNCTHKDLLLWKWAHFQRWTNTPYPVWAFAQYVSVALHCVFAQHGREHGRK